MASSDPVLSARARVAYASRRDRGGNADALDAARRDLTAAKLERAVRVAIAAAPPLTVDQREQIARLLSAGGAR